MVDVYTAVCNAVNFSRCIYITYIHTCFRSQYMARFFSRVFEDVFRVCFFQVGIVNFFQYKMHVTVSAGAYLKGG